MATPAPQPVPVPTAEPPRKGNGVAVAGFVISVVALMLCFVPIVNNFAFALAFIGLVFGIVGLIRARKGAARRGLAIATIIIAVLSGIGVLASQAIYGAAIDEVSESLDEATQELDESIDRMDGNATEDILANDLSVEIEAFDGEADEYGLVTSKLPVTLTNTADDVHSYNVQIEAIDASGARIGDDYASTSELGSGQSESFDLFQFVSEDELPALQDAEFRIVEVQQY